MLLLKIFIILLLIVFPFGEIFRFGFGNDIFIKPLDVISALLFIATIIFYIRKKQFTKVLRWYYFAFPCIGLASLLLNSYWLQGHELLVSFLYLLRWVSYMGIFFAVIQLDNSFKKIFIKGLVIDGIIVLLIGYIQYFFYPSLKNLYYLGWDDHLYRMFSSFLDPNFVGTFFVLYFLFILGLLFNIFKDLSTKAKVFYYILIAITLVAIFLTYSRSALLMLLVSGTTFFILLKKRKFILYLIGAIVIFIIVISPFFYIENLDLFRTASSVARLGTTQHAFTIIQKNPIIGVGFDGYRYAQIKYHLIKSTSPFPSHSASGEDTSLLFVFATTGIVGLFAYCYLWFHLLKNAKNNYRKNIFAAIFISSTTGLFINSLFINSLFYPEIIFWMWVIIGFARDKKATAL